MFSPSVEVPGKPDADKIAYFSAAARRTGHRRVCFWKMSLSVLANHTLCLSPGALPAAEVAGLYVHIPFCFHKCHYCDFYSITQQPAERMEEFVTLLLREARMWAGERGPTIKPRTIFFGGGTPTLLPMDAMRRLIDGLKEIFALTPSPGNPGEGRRIESSDHLIIESLNADFSSSMIQSKSCPHPNPLPEYRAREQMRPSGVSEWTIEANPATVNESYCAMLRELGVDRLSFGAQSFDRHELAVLERHHEPADVRRSVEIARATGFNRINVDLIFAIPGQTMEKWIESLDMALSLGTTHLSAYNLTYEPNTAMTMKKKLGQIKPLDESTELAMLLETRRRMTAGGLAPYEISNFAVPGQECQHNLGYWMGEDYIGLGPAAASHVQGHRWKNAPNLGQWEAAIARGELPAVDLEILSARQRMGELVMLQLRLGRGLQFADFTRRTGCDARQLFADIVPRYVQTGLLEIDASSLRLTEAGIPIADAIAAEFLA